MINLILIYIHTNKQSDEKGMKIESIFHIKYGVFFSPGYDNGKEPATSSAVVDCSGSNDCTGK